MRLFVKTPDGETKTHYYLFSTHYTPSENIEGEDKAHYAGWAHMGHIKTHAGARIDIEEIQEEIKLDAKRFDITGEENAGGDRGQRPMECSATRDKPAKRGNLLRGNTPNRRPACQSQ